MTVRAKQEFLKSIEDRLSLANGIDELIRIGESLGEFLENYFPNEQIKRACTVQLSAIRELERLEIGGRISYGERKLEQNNWISIIMNLLREADDLLSVNVQKKEYELSIEQLEKEENRLQRSDMSSKIQIIDQLHRIWKEEIGRNEIEKQLRLKLNEIKNLRNQVNTGRQDFRETIKSENIWLYQTFDLLDSMKDFLQEGANDWQDTVDVELNEERLIEEAHIALKKLAFDRRQLQQFNRVFRDSYHACLFIIHGRKGHGQQWFYNKILETNKFFLRKPESVYLLIDLTSVAAGAEMPEIMSAFRKFDIRYEGNTNQWLDDLVNRLTAYLIHRDVIICFRNPDDDYSQKLSRLCNKIAEGVNAAARKIFFIFYFDRKIRAEIEWAGNPVVADDLQPIDSEILWNWIDFCFTDSFQPVWDHYGELFDLEKRECLEKVKNVIVALKAPEMQLEADLFGDREAMSLPTIPADTFFKKFVNEKLSLNWDKCKEVWLKY